MRVVASAAMVAAIVAKTAAMLAICSERQDASMTWLLFQACSNQRSENPSQLAIESPALNA